MNNTKYVTLEQAFEITQIPVSSLRRKISEGNLTAYKPGKCLLIDVKDLETFIKRSKVENAS